MHRSLLLRASFKPLASSRSTLARRLLSGLPSRPLLRPRTAPRIAHKTRFLESRSSFPSFSTKEATSSTGLRTYLRSGVMYPRLPTLLVSGLVGYGAYYLYHDSAVLYSDSPPSSATDSDPKGPTRDVIVIGVNDLQYARVYGDSPLEKISEMYGLNVVAKLTPEQVDEKLHSHEESYNVHRGRGVVRYDLVQLASNIPIEDDHSEKVIEVPYVAAASSAADADLSVPAVDDWMFWGIYDGHAGWATSARLRQALIPVVAHELNQTYHTAPQHSPSAEAIDTAIKTGFSKLDHEIVNEQAKKALASNNKSVAAELLAPALSGSCALLSFYDSRSKNLRVAVTGDSRAVLGRRQPDGTWEATVLSIDQTADEPSEEARLRREHPNEPNVVSNGRIMGGLQPSRAFGDATYKWTSSMINSLQNVAFVRSGSARAKTPPYVTARPEVQTIRVHPENGDFLIMASDGLWEMITNEEAVGLVSRWLESEHSKGLPDRNRASASLWKRLTESLPLPTLPSLHSLANKVTGGSSDGNGNEEDEVPLRKRQWRIAKDAETLVVKDRNVATHVIRNALGGSDQDNLAALLSLQSPYARRYRDDLTVQVIFFGEGRETTTGTGPNAGITVNLDATAPTKAPRPRL